MPTTQATQYVYSTFGEDPDLAELVEMFVDGLPARIAELKDLATSNDLESLCRAAHRLRGAGGSYGFSRVSCAAGRLEDACTESLSKSEIATALEAMIELCDRVRAGAPE